MHRSVEPVAGAVAGEHTPGAVGAVRRRGQPEHQHTGAVDRRSRARHGPSSPRRGTRPASRRRPAHARRRAADSAGTSSTSAGQVKERIHGLHTKLQHRDGETKASTPLVDVVPVGAPRPDADDRQGPARPRPGPAPRRGRREQAEAAAERIAALKHGRRRLRVAARARRETAAPIAKARGLKVQRRQGPARVRLRRLDRRRAEEADEAARVEHGAACPVDVPLPQAARASPRCRPGWSSTIDGCAPRITGGVVVCVSHADPIKAAVAHAMGTHLDLFQRIVISPCSVTAIAYSARRSGRADRQLDRRLARRAAAVMRR